ncbi:MAG: extracellular solute-binding protein, partial [Acidimicrobiales bacterium]
MGARSWRGSAWSPRAVRKGAVAMACAGAAIALAACGSSASGPQTLTLYNGQHVQTTEALVKAFEHKTGIHVVVHSNDESVLVDQIQAEGARSPADVIFTENTPALSYLQSNHLLAHLPARVFDDTSKRFDSAAHDWVGVSARVSVLVYNP